VSNGRIYLSRYFRIFFILIIIFSIFIHFQQVCIFREKEGSVANKS
jgi:hypothetical protein